ncbi:MAG: amidase [Candidatus Lustribacter sp.]|jgi:Asp-tRNA(Asn)/Glu-tRNA(Gln) amidotransferase A subunit family amidase
MYDPKTARFLSFAAARARFAGGDDSPRAFLERCLETIERLEPAVRAFVLLDVESARRDADAAGARWRAGAPRSLVDGLPVGVKDCFDVRGFPTRVNCAYFDAAPDAADDAAHVDALRRGGAVILGKTVTTELTMAAPGPTWNPWDLTRTPGGSSSGSAAAVAAGMLPVATGSQVRGSVIRPASICGVIGMKPTFGALNHFGGVDPQPSINHLGLLGGTLADVWTVACHIATVAGGDPGYVPHFREATLPKAQRPQRLVRQYTAGWQHTDDASRAAFAAYLRALERSGIEILEPSASPELTGYEAATASVPEWFFDLMLWETRWPMLAWLEARPDAFSAPMRGYIERAGQLTVADYARACGARERLRAQHRALAGAVDGFISLAHIGPGQVGQPLGGTPWYNDASSAIGAPSFNLPLLAVDGLPLGVQLMGFEHDDAGTLALARWLLEAP